jgi:hypothetical protein
VKLSIFAGALALAAVALPGPVLAQSWQSMGARQARLDTRIDQGVRTGALNRAEATRLRTEFRQLGRLEARYRASNGLSMSERRDLDRRYDALSARVRIQANDRQHDRRGHR